MTWDDAAGDDAAGDDAAGNMSPAAGGEAWFDGAAAVRRDAVRAG